MFETGDHEYAHDGPTALLRRAVDIAGNEAEAGIRENPRNSNRGPRVEAYLKSVGLGPGYSWCAAFVYWCFREAAGTATTPIVKTGGCLDHWTRCEKAGARRIKADEALGNPGLLRPGHIFIMDHGRGFGHTGMIERISGGLLHTIEGNTDASRTREGGGVYRLTRKVGEINKGFIDYTKASA
ncbi:MAG: CHAP domain-containing protein [Nitrospirae bacterium]|nr:CHAP domain-containing protein [Nitrospirota bacterium]